MGFRGRTRLAVIILASTSLVGCKTTTVEKQLSRNQWWVCDGDKHPDRCGANPEKGLPKTCFKQGRGIKDYQKLPDGALIVYCED